MSSLGEGFSTHHNIKCSYGCVPCHEQAHRVVLVQIQDLLRVKGRPS